MKYENNKQSSGKRFASEEKIISGLLLKVSVSIESLGVSLLL